MSVKGAEIKLRKSKIEEGIKILENMDSSSFIDNKTPSKIIRNYNRGLDKLDEIEDRHINLFFKLSEILNSSKEESINLHHRMRPHRAFITINTGVCYGYYKPKFILDISKLYEDSLSSQDWIERKNALEFIHPYSNTIKNTGVEYKMYVIDTIIARKNKEIIYNLDNKIKKDVGYNYEELINGKYIRIIKESNLDNLVKTDIEINEIKDLLKKVEN